MVHKALGLGITFFDTVDIYGERDGSEACLSRILGERRKEIVLTSKFGTKMDEAGILAGSSRRSIMRAVEASLRRLNTDWIDLYQLHQPDPATPIEETLRALDDLVHAGKVRSIGCFNLPGWQVSRRSGRRERAGSTRSFSARTCGNRPHHRLMEETTDLDML